MANSFILEMRELYIGDALLREDILNVAIGIAALVDAAMPAPKQFVCAAVWHY